MIARMGIWKVSCRRTFALIDPTPPVSSSFINVHPYCSMTIARKIISPLRLGGPGGVSRKSTTTTTTTTTITPTPGESKSSSSTNVHVIKNGGLTTKTSNQHHHAYASWLRAVLQEVTTLHIPGKGVPFGELLETLIAVRLGPQALTIDVRLKREQELREVRRWGAAVTVQAWVRGSAARRHVGGGKWKVRRRWMCRLFFLGR